MKNVKNKPTGMFNVLSPFTWLYKVLQYFTLDLIKSISISGHILKVKIAPFHVAIWSAQGQNKGRKIIANIKDASITDQ